MRVGSRCEGDIHLISEVQFHLGDNTPEIGDMEGNVYFHAGNITVEENFDSMSKNEQDIMRMCPFDRIMDFIGKVQLCLVFTKLNLEIWNENIHFHAGMGSQRG